VLVSEVTALTPSSSGERIASRREYSSRDTRTSDLGVTAIVCGANLEEVVAVPLLAAYLILLYYDLRVREEGSASIERDRAPIAAPGALVATPKTEPAKRRSPRR
jgi:hypothetical protein